jgi:hypothetical protein
MHGWTSITPGCFNTKSFLGKIPQLFLNTSASTMELDKSHDFSYCRNHILPVIIPKFHTLLVFTYAIEERELNVGRSGEAWFCPRSQFSPSSKAVFICMSSCVRESWVIYHVYSKGVNRTL